MKKNTSIKSKVKSLFDSSGAKKKKAPAKRKMSNRKKPINQQRAVKPVGRKKVTEMELPHAPQSIPLEQHHEVVRS